jgi:RimJ/RimL family protein N-acetyltransferase
MIAGDFLPIKTERLVLRKFRASDAADFLAYRQLPSVSRFQGDGWEKMTAEEAAAFVRKMAKSRPGLPGHWFQIAIERADTGQLIGDCAIHTLPNDARQAEIGFSLNPAFQRRGYAREMIQALIGFIFTEMDMHRIIAITDVRNISSVSLLERAGFRREGHFRQNAWNKGEYTDEFLYAMLREEFRDRATIKA